jgi:uncharacterized membrane protein HdeD (DUF308 family)
MDGRADQRQALSWWARPRMWEWALAFGVVSGLVGAMVLAWPGRTLTVVAVLFGVQLIAAGIFRFVAALASDGQTGAMHVLLAMLGVLSFIAGLYALRHVLVTLTALALLLGIFWIVNGAMEVFGAMPYRGMPGRGGRWRWGCSASWPARPCLVSPASRCSLSRP